MECPLCNQMGIVSEMNFIDISEEDFSEIWDCPNCKTVVIIIGMDLKTYVEGN